MLPELKLPEPDSHNAALIKEFITAYMVPGESTDFGHIHPTLRQYIREVIPEEFKYLVVYCESRLHFSLRTPVLKIRLVSQEMDEIDNMSYVICQSVEEALKKFLSERGISRSYNQIKDDFTIVLSKERYPASILHNHTNSR
ncbi:MAG: hypothetical protein Sylvanvirus4_44 [Sylvanvirus sp.]|uniref:Uncharacterized protein n=1 Tax=Sylvanvirus sp. TaxID=2487774 RepID=A0A3G5AHJ0_9VIRU|nr:MAG: hypothetical protein Sylvanvirus4_44 [Sylvanvirus sp.]